MDIKQAEQEYLKAIQSGDRQKIEGAVKTLQGLERASMTIKDWTTLADINLRNDIMKPISKRVVLE